MSVLHSQLKYIVVGPSGVGKSSLLYQFTDEAFLDAHETTVGVEFGAKMLTVDGEDVKIQIWDTAGQESFKAITRSYYNRASGALLVYDITSRRSFSYLETWLLDIRQNADPSLVIILVGNKCDLESARKVSTAEGQAFAAKHGINHFMETSARTGENVTRVFEKSARNVLELREGGAFQRHEVGESIIIGSGNQNPNTRHTKEAQAWKCC